MSNAIRIGTSFASAVIVGYALCTLVFWIWPEAAANFMNALFHGLDFRKLQAGPSLFSFGAFLYALIVMGVWAFGLGAFFGWLSAKLGGAKTSS